MDKYGLTKRLYKNLKCNYILKPVIEKVKEQIRKNKVKAEEFQKEEEKIQQGITD